MFTRNFVRNMSVNLSPKIVNNAELAERRLIELRNKLEEVKKIKIQQKVQELIKENAVLANNIETAKAELIRLETLNGKKQYQLPGNKATVTSVQVPLSTKNEENQEIISTDAKNVKKEKESAKKKEKVANPPSNAETIIDVRKLDLRIGKIIDINKHPDADSLYVEKIDCGEENPRTVVSGLVNHVPIEEMREKIVMVLCNLKPVKMRGVTSEAMVMCASSPEKVEVLLPPSGAIPGDLVSCEGYPREPEPQLNPKKKIFETCAPDLMTDDKKVACYKGNPLVVPSKGPVVAPTLKRVHVK